MDRDGEFGPARLPAFGKEMLAKETSRGAHNFST